MPDKDAPKPVCGIVMPISALEGCSEEHWSEVHEILSEAIGDAGFEPNLVSNADDVGIIQKRIIQNLYDNPVVLCDVSAKNPNVMFELGLRLAFDKPTIIIKDDKTSYSFDTAPIEHLEYPRDLRFSRIIEFKEKLTDKILKTHEKSQDDPSYTTFLKNFGEFKVAKIEKKEVPGQEIILDELKSLRSAMNRLDGVGASRTRFLKRNSDDLQFCLRGAKQDQVRKIMSEFVMESGVTDAYVSDEGDHRHLNLVVSPAADRSGLKELMRKKYPRVGSQAKKNAVAQWELE